MLSAYTQGLLAVIGINAILGLSVYVIWSTGQLSIGNAAFMGLGAYGSSLLTVRLGVPVVAALPLAAVATGLVGIAVGFPALRLRGIYLAMATIGLGEIARAFFLNFDTTGGPQGFSGMPFVDMTFIWIWVGAALALVLALERSDLWLEFRAIHDDEDAAEIIGCNTTAAKVAAFGLGGLLAALGGGLFAHYNVYIEPANFGVLVSIGMVLFVILGGSTTAWGPLVGAAVLTLLPEFLRPLADWRMAVYGAVLVAVVVLRPRGLLLPGVLGRALRLARLLLPGSARAEGGATEA